MVTSRVWPGGQRGMYSLSLSMSQKGAQSFKVSRQIIKDKALSLYIGDNFAASDGWVTALLKRYKAWENDLTFVDTEDESNQSGEDIGGQKLPTNYNSKYLIIIIKPCLLRSIEVLCNIDTKSEKIRKYKIKINDMKQHQTTLFEIQYCKNSLDEISIYLPHYNMRILSMDNLLSYYINGEKQKPEKK